MLPVTQMTQCRIYLIDRSISVSDPEINTKWIYNIQISQTYPSAQMLYWIYLTKHFTWQNILTRAEGMRHSCTTHGSRYVQYNSISHFGVLNDSLWYSRNTYVYIHKGQGVWCIISLIARFMGPSWGRQDPGGPHVGHIKFVIWVTLLLVPTEFLL